MQPTRTSASVISGKRSRFSRPWLRCRAERLQRLLQNVDSLPVFIELEVLVRRVIERAVAGTVGDNGALPYRRDDVHVAGAGLHDEAKLCARIECPQPGQKTAHQHVVAIALPRLFVSPKLELERCLDRLMAR